MEWEDGRIGYIKMITRSCDVYLDAGLSIVYVIQGDASIFYLGRKQSLSSNQMFITQGALNVKLNLKSASLVLISITENFTNLFNLNNAIIDYTLLNRSNVEYQHLINLVRDLIEYVSLDLSVYQSTVAESKLIIVIKYFVNKFSKQINSGKLKIEDVINYMRLNYGNNIGLNDVSDRFSVTPQYLSSFFRKNHGNSFNQELNNIRLYNASRYLTNTSKPIIDVVYDSGFNSVATFNRVFKKHFRITPVDYRKKYSKYVVDSTNNDKQECVTNLLKQQITVENITINLNTPAVNFVMPKTILLNRVANKDTIDLLNNLHIEYVEFLINEIQQLDLFLYEFNQKIDFLLKNHFSLILNFDSLNGLVFLEDILNYFSNIIGEKNISSWKIRFQISDLDYLNNVKKILNKFGMEDNLELVGTYNELIENKFVDNLQNYHFHLISNKPFKDEFYQLIQLRKLGFKNLSIQLLPFKKSNLCVLHDTEYYGATLVSQILKLQNVVNMIELPPLYDTPSSILLHGDYGIVSNNGLAKSSFYALKLLARIFASVIFMNKHVVISKDGQGDISITVHNKQKLLNDQTTVNYRNYNEILSGQNLKIRIKIEGLQNGQYRLKTRSVNNKSANLIKIWEQLGFIADRINVNEGHYIASKTLPNIFLKDLVVKDNQLNLNLDIKPNEIQNIHLIKK